MAEKARMHHIDVLKGLCVLFVVITHMKWSDAERLAYAFPFWISMAVPVFMIISGYVVSRSYERRGFSGFADALAPSHVIPFFLRFLLPFLLFLPFEARYAFKKASVSGIGEFLSGYLCGGWGPGGYYVSMMFQLVVLFPFVWHLIRRFPAGGFAFCFAGNLLYEILQWHFGMSASVYRLLIFRYLAALAFGAFLAQPLPGRDSRGFRAMRWTMLVAGGVYILFNSYLDWRPFFIVKSPTVCLFAALFAMAVVAFWIGKAGCLRCRLLAVFGLASYEIFLFQKLYYLLWARKLFRHIPGFPLQCICSVVVCCAVGVLLYRVTSGPFAKSIAYIRGRLVV